MAHGGYLRQGAAAGTGDPHRKDGARGHAQGQTQQQPAPYAAIAAPPLAQPGVGKHTPWRAGDQYHAHVNTIRGFPALSPAPPLPAHDTHGPTPLAQCTPIADLAARAREIDLLSQRIIPLLPIPLRHHVQYASVRNDRILLLVESPVWATRARMEQAHILAAVHGIGLAATSVTAKVVPIQAPHGSSATARPPSPHTAQCIREAAKAIKDPDLKALFDELAAWADRPPAG
ncbi:MAG: DUF721 domain-containing protein [Rhodanobacteraceae bacterium]|nr:MAG: DUF721 domain-containing protein [Rhodanobacteraceae bacterium]